MGASIEWKGGAEFSTSNFGYLQHFTKSLDRSPLKFNPGEKTPLHTRSSAKGPQREFCVCGSRRFRAREYEPEQEFRGSEMLEPGIRAPESPETKDTTVLSRIHLMSEERFGLSNL